MKFAKKFFLHFESFSHANQPANRVNVFCDFFPMRRRKTSPSVDPVNKGGKTRSRVLFGTRIVIMNARDSNVRSFVRSIDRRAKKDCSKVRIMQMELAR